VCDEQRILARAPTPEQSWELVAGLVEELTNQGRIQDKCDMQPNPELTAEQTKILIQLGKDSDGPDCEMPRKILVELQTLNLVVISGGRFLLTKHGERCLQNHAGKLTLRLKLNNPCAYALPYERQQK
jgi:hypothetical protein